MKKKLLTFVSLFGLLCIPLPTIAEEQDCNTPEISQTTVSLSLPTFPEGVSSLKAVFEVAPATEYSDAKKVVFSKGNLKFHNYNSRICADGLSHNGFFEFATEQYNKLNYESLNGNSGVTELFNYGTSGYEYTPTEHRYYVNYSLIGDKAFSDWGIFNPISNGGNLPGLWRTLTSDEWDYLFTHCKEKGHLGKGRVTKSNKYYSYGELGYVNGVILLPDDWILPEGLSFSFNSTPSFSDNVYSIEDWEKMEAAGAVFLPTSPYREGDNVNYIGNEIGYYWTSICNDKFRVLSLGNLSTVDDNLDDNGYSVRLVHDL